MKKYLFLFLACLTANASEITFDESESLNLGLTISSVDASNQYVLTGKIIAPSALPDSSIKIFLGGSLIDQKDFSIAGEQSFLKLLNLSQEQALSSDLCIDVEIPQGANVATQDIKITALKEANLSQNELAHLNSLNANRYSSQSFAFVNGVNILNDNLKINLSDANKITDITSDSFFENLLNRAVRAVFYVDANYGNDSFLGTSFYFNGNDGPKKTLQSALINSYLMPDNVISEIVIQESSLAYSSEILSAKADSILIIRPEGTVVIKGTWMEETIDNSNVQSDSNSRLDSSILYNNTPPLEVLNHRDNLNEN